jgi:hypothetical protein
MQSGIETSLRGVIRDDVHHSTDKLPGNQSIN